MEINRTEEFDLAYRFVNETNQNIFLTGNAGTGKTTFLKYLRENSTKKTVVVAPTGVAAINARGVTLHSLFQLPPGIIAPIVNSLQSNSGDIKHHPLLSKIHYHKEKLNLLQNVELLIIDEASMVACYIVDAIDTILRNIKGKPRLPFGGIQILFIGDLHQLPPVVKNEDWHLLQDYYSSAFFFDSFVLRENAPVIIKLNKIYRQKDEKFIEILNGIRNNNIAEENFRLLNSRLNRFFPDGSLSDNPAESEGYITLTTHNYQSDEINKRKLSGLPEQTYFFHADINGEFPENIYPAEKELRLKAGAQVMFLKNDTEGKQYFNGKIGIITDLEGDYIKVKCKDDPFQIKVKKSEWQNIRYKLNRDTGKIDEEISGKFIQYPLRLAWAITIHKSQGLTFDKVIIDAEKAFAIGQVYVALSRCTSLEGLILNSPIRRNFLGAHEDLKEWEDNYYDRNLSELFNESRQDFLFCELLDIFTWQGLYSQLSELNDFISENLNQPGISAKISNESFAWLSEQMKKLNELNEISEKFKAIIHIISNENPVIEKNERLQKRIKEAANYFYSELSRWNEKFLNHPLSAGTKKLSRKIDNLLEGINSTAEDILQKINNCRNGFLPDDYFQRKERLSSIRENRIKTSYAKNKILKVNTVEETVKHFREGKSIEQVAEERNLVVSTIEGHLAQAIKKNLIRIEEVMQIAEAKKIAEYFPENLSEIRLAEIKEKVPPEVTYGKLRIVLAFLLKEKHDKVRN